MKSKILCELRAGETNLSVLPNLHYDIVQIESIQIPRIWNYLPNTTIIFTDSLGVVSNIAFKSSSPSVVDFCNYLQTQLTAFETGVAVYTHSIDYTTTTFTFNSTANFSITFDKYLAQHLGLTTVTSPGRWGMLVGNTFTSGRFFFGDQMLLIKSSISHSGQGTSFDNFTEEMSAPLNSTQASRYNLALPIRTSRGSTETWFLGDFGIKYNIGQLPQTLNIQINNEFGHLIDITPQRMYITIHIPS